MNKFNKGDICLSIYADKFFIGTVDEVDEDFEDNGTFTMVHYTNSDGKKNAGYQCHLFTLEQAKKEFRQWMEINKKINEVYGVNLPDDIDKK